MNTFVIGTQSIWSVFSEKMNLQKIKFSNSQVFSSFLSQLIFFPGVELIVSLINKARIRQVHAQLAPIMIFPLLLTIITGSLFQVAALTNNVDNFIWLLDWHRGKFGRINLEMIYPFLNAFGLLMVGTTGITIWLQTRSRRK